MKLRRKAWGIKNLQSVLKRGGKGINSASTDSEVTSKKNCLKADVRTPEMQVENIRKKSSHFIFMEENFRAEKNP